jgi:hypothetical protein
MRVMDIEGHLKMTEEVQDPLKPLSEVYAPDGRQANFVGTLADTHEILTQIALHTGVPVNVRQLFETAKNVSLYSWFVYRFHQVAESVAYSALEMALRERAGFVEWSGPTAPRPPTLRRLLDQAKREGWIRNESFPSLRRMATENARMAKLALRLPTMTTNEDYPIVEPTEDEINAEVRTLDFVQILAENVPQLRNWLAHGSSMLSPRSIRTLELVAEVVNQLFVATA